MMILGLGSDLIDITSHRPFDRALRRPFHQRCFTDIEKRRARAGR
jgi:phosphopantetheinyl transferase (holo-ACP synthase)